SAVRDPQLIDELSKAFGSQCIVLAIDARKIDNQWIVHTHGGRNPTDKKLFTWAKEGQERGAGEILFTSMDHDGTKNGFANDSLQKLHQLLHIPVIASGGAGNMGHFIDTFLLGKADAALAASIFHFGEIQIPDLKMFLHQRNINVRL
ncbi:MAG TPA: HisA/HisF-related TIM barrel protein, partial [Chryseolinea sp.]|nr:HisA/HisF-related TIM barrel protein [Chryseolinea sp.]